MNQKAVSVLVFDTSAFAICFAVWTLYGVLGTFLIQNRLFPWDAFQTGLLLAIPILTGSILRLPVGLLTDHYGGRIVLTMVMLISALALATVGLATRYSHFVVAGLGFGLSGASFAAGVAHTSQWFPKERQGTVLGIFGLGNLGAALTSLAVPSLLSHLTDNGINPEGWRALPKIYAACLVGMAILFFILVPSTRISQGKKVGLTQRLVPLKNLRVWRFGLYYFYVFGGFVALSQWLVPYYVNAYNVSLKTAGALAASFTLSCAFTRVVGGWISDHWGARRVLYTVFGIALTGSLLLAIPDIPLAFFTPLVLVVGIFFGIGMGAVYKHIPSYFPDDVGVVGGLVGVIGGLGGFLLPMFFGYLLKTTGLWTSCWMVFAVLSFSCFLWMHGVVTQMEKERGTRLEPAHA